MTTTANNNNERKEFVNKIGFSGSFYKFKIEYKCLVYFYFGQTTQQIITNYQ